MVKVVHLKVATREELHRTVNSCCRFARSPHTFLPNGSVPGLLAYRLWSSTTLISMTRNSFPIVLTCLLEYFRAAANLLRQLFARGEFPHQSPTNIVLAVPLDLLAGLAVEDQANRELAVPISAKCVRLCRWRTLLFSHIFPVT